MGLSEEQLVKQMEQWHPYAFNMGHGKTIPFKDYQEAAQVLMERNMTEVLNDSQTKATVLPETHVPKMPRIVDVPPRNTGGPNKSKASTARSFLDD